jgi:hypothetical protein
MILTSRFMILINYVKVTWTTSETLVTASSSISDSKDDTYSAWKKKEILACLDVHR